MSFSPTQLTTLLHAVERLLEAHAGLRGELHEANARLEEAQRSCAKWRWPVKQPNLNPNPPLNRR